MTEMASHPASLAWRARSMQPAVLLVVTWGMTEMRPFTWSTVISATRLRWASERAIPSPMVPQGKMPWTPDWTIHSR